MLKYHIYIYIIDFIFTDTFIFNRRYNAIGDHSINNVLRSTDSQSIRIKSRRNFREAAHIARKERTFLPSVNRW